MLRPLLSLLMLAGIGTIAAEDAPGANTCCAPGAACCVPGAACCEPGAACCVAGAACCTADAACCTTAKKTEKADDAKAKACCATGTAAKKPVIEGEAATAKAEAPAAVAQP